MKKYILSTTLILMMSSSVHATVTVTWAADATANIQAAIDTGDPNVIIPNVGSNWVVRPLFLNRSNQQITFAPGVVVMAKSGAYPNVGDCMFSAVGKTNITLSGYGATLQMLKSEYTTGEWRHTISFKTCSNIDVLGLTALDSGGDGVFIADSYVFPYCCTDVLIKDCVFNNHRRLGAAVVSGKNVTFENCVFSNAIGTAPQAGVDLEPDQTNQRLENIDFYNCFATGNSGSGYVMATARLNSTSAPIDVELHRCYAQDQVNSYELFLLPATTAGGTYKATDCSFVSDAKATLWAERNFSSGVTFQATRCRFESKLQNPIRIMDSAPPQCGNLTFTDCVAHYQGTNPYISWEIFDGANSGITNIAGNIDVYNPNGAKVNWGSNYSNITLLSTPHNTRVPVVAITSPTMGATITTGGTLNFTATAYDPDTGTADGNGMSQVIFEVWRCENATNALKTTVTDTSAAYATSISTSGWVPGIYTLVTRGLSADGSEKRRITYIRIATGGSVPNPVSLYPFNETAGTTAADTVRGSAANASLFGGTIWAPGKIGGAIQFDGVNDYALALNAVPAGSTSFTISAWVNATTAATWGSIVKNWGTTQTGAFHFGFDSTLGKLSNQLATGTKTIQPGALSLGVWHHVAVTYDGASATQVLYVDGSAVNTQTNAPASLTARSPNMGIGVKTTDATTGPAASSAGYWNGKIDDLGFFNTALTADQIAAIKTNGDNGIGLAGGSPPPPPPPPPSGTTPVSAYKFNETTGNTASDAIRGASGNATLANFSGAQWVPGKIGNALQFDGVNDYALALNAVPTGSTSFTISVWVNATSAATWGTIVKNWGMTQTGAFHFGFDSALGKLSNQLATGTKTLQPSALGLGVWHHVAVTYDGATATQVLYVDGSAVNTQTNAPASLTARSPNMGIGVKTTDATTGPATSSAGYWNGLMDDLAFFNTALSAAQISTIKTNGDNGISVSSQ